MSKLVIVESPTKARTIRNYLPQDYRVEASMGHVRDLPASAEEVPAAYKDKSWANLGVNVEDHFSPLYVIPKSKKKIVKELQTALKNADEVILATDEDREGESISWHLLQLLQPKVPIKRMVFHEITQEAIRHALDNCREIDENLVHAQETRRILDRLVGYTLSPLLWKKIAWGLSAGRVQSVAVRLIVQRERARRAFKTAGYWDLKAELEQHKNPFQAKLMTLGGTKLANGSDFDPNSGALLPNKQVVVLDEAQAIALKDCLTDKPWEVINTEEKPSVRKPAPPFTTSTLQQEANRKLGISARDTMRVAQKLYEEGYITYMRTDSVHLSDQAVTAARSCVQQMYGKEYLSPQPKQYTTKSKGAQEAHEAIRPAGTEFRIPNQTGLKERELALYELIWKRTVACQMADARITQLSVTLRVEDAEFRAGGKRIDFPGYFRAYVEGSDDPDAALENQEVILPPLKVGDRPNCREIEPMSHETQPPARYTEASLVKTLESEGVGRPSTYASIIGTIIDRGYVQMRGKALTPTFTAFAVVSLLEAHFPDLVDTGFTSRMEQKLDEIAIGKTQWLPYLQGFFLGESGLENQVKVRQDQIDPAIAKAIELENLAAKVKIGKFGPYIEIPQGEEIITASIPHDLTPADLNPDQVAVLLKQKTEGPDKVGTHPETGEPIFILIGAYGPYVQLGEATEENKKPKRTSLPKGVKPEDVTLEMAVGLLALPRNLGEHPESGKNIKASLGRFGPYVVHDQGKDGKDYRSLKGDDDVLTITLERALALLAEPKRGRGSRTPLKELGLHPEDQEPVNLFKGPYGVYIKHGKVNASLPEGETEETITLEKALPLLADKAGTKKTTRKKATTSTVKGTKKTTTKTTKKTSGTGAAKKTTTKRTTTRKTSASKADQSSEAS
ncbi:MULTISPECIES: type I DNA topoisomerase [unclassified Synechocystis]|uniref:type I DNA topoisomerase n=1 Tax=unclassified Synechocystis TaxID=2640012 RepID=UPI0004139F20|nr:MULTISPECIES: type I DNA topoisomerase [unclassified Synechocystis]AIE72804.1 DNA topoisomerase I [Synechocystis sp. PCC 6714]MCT0254559.1 type I DNA topoisomerase [Synechocystis sp. CS-94]